MKNLRNLNRAQVENVVGRVKETKNDAILLQCLDSYSVWALKDDISVTPSLKKFGYWEAWITAWFTNNIEPGDFVIDVGGHCGYYTMLFERLVGDTGDVIVYECNPRYVNLLKDTRAHNNANFKIRPVALADAVGEAVLRFPGRYTGSASITHGFNKKWGETQSIRVEASTLDTEFEGVVTPHVLKIDAESAEEMILAGGRELLNRMDAPVVVLEYSPTGVYSDNFNKWLFEYGEVTRIGFDGKEQSINEQYLLNLKDWDMIVVRKKW